jgi:hypothetical protein
MEVNMKKVVFLLIMAFVMVGFASAVNIAHPPWDSGDETAARSPLLAEYNVQQDVVTLSTVLVLYMPVTVKISSFQVVMAFNEPAIQPQSGIIKLSSMSPIYGQTWTTCAAGNYYLRC